VQLHRRRDVHRFWANAPNWIGETEPTDDDDSADFHTGIVLDVNGPLKGSVPDPHTYARFISRLGEPALELGCRDGDPLLALRADGLDVEGLDSSADVLAKLQRAATDRGQPGDTLVELILLRVVVERMQVDVSQLAMPCNT